MEKLLEVKNLSIDYKVKDGWLSAVKNVNFTLNKGEIFAIVGESGSGKSTVAYSLMRLLMSGNEKISGEAIFNGADILSLADVEMTKIRGKEIGMIFQNPLDSLNPVYTAGWQVEEALKLDNMDKKQAWQRTLNLFQDVKIPDAQKRMDSFPHELSGGMRQRVMIAMMLSRRPQLLIADEPTTALDVTIEAQILEIIKNLKEEYDASIIIITHNFGVVAEVADKIGVMYAGELVEVGDVYQIFENPSHPYTKMLLRALPSIRKQEGMLETIHGSVPKLVGEIVGCRFANRCPAVKDICRKETPPEKIAGENHIYFCHGGEF